MSYLYTNRRRIRKKDEMPESVGLHANYWCLKITKLFGWFGSVLGTDSNFSTRDDAHEYYET